VQLMGLVLLGGLEGQVVKFVLLIGFEGKVVGLVLRVVYETKVGLLLLMDPTVEVLWWQSGQHEGLAREVVELMQLVDRGQPGGRGEEVVQLLVKFSTKLLELVIDESQSDRDGVGFVFGVRKDGGADGVCES